MEIYQDESRTITLLSSRGDFVTNPERTDDYKGGQRRTLSGQLKTWQVYHKYEENITIEELSQSNLEILEDIIYNRQTVWYCPDVIKRNEELYEVKISTPIQNAIYNESTGRYNTMIKVREV